MILRGEEPPQAVHWTVADLLRWTEECFQKLGFTTPRLDAEILLAAALECARIDLYTGYQKLVEPKERVRFRALVERRRRREPVAYIIGKREFFSLAFEVTPAVLIPRPETEHLVEVAIQKLTSAGESPRALDLGTGSGNIAVAVAVHVPQAAIDAVDLSRAALDVARRNAIRHSVEGRIAFREGDLFGALGPGAGPYTLILSNPPYISAGEYPGLMDDVRMYEPRDALLDSRGSDGLGFYRAIAGEAIRHLAPHGWVAVELGAGKAGDVAGIFASAGWSLESVSRDYGGIERVMVLRPPSR